jgi:predicted acylesterase/phospholipase RssA
VASEGGGIRAAYWTAAVLDALATRQPLFTQQLFALSGVSGGSLGVTAWLATQRERWCEQAAAPVVSLSGTAPGAAQTLGADFVSPALAGLFYADLIQRFLPVPVPAFDRSRAIEAAWQRAFDHLPGQPLAQPLATLYQRCRRPLPHLLLNATRVETGQRAVLSRLPATLFSNTFNDAMAAGSLAPRQSLAGLVHHSARFPLVSPAGTVEFEDAAAGELPAFRLVDGGYFDNSGVETVLDLVLALQKLAPPERPFRTLLLLVRNEASGLAAQPANNAAPAAWFPEIGSILSALMNARGSHAVTARAAALRALDPHDIIDLVVPPGTPAAAAPLGWALSPQVRAALDTAAAQVAECAARQIEDRAAGRPPSCRTTP